MATPTIEYSHLNKFLSSVGLGLMVVGVLAVWTFFESLGALTIEAEEVAALTPRAREIILQRQWMISIAQVVLPALCILLFFGGAVLAIIGAWRWRTRQRKDDAAVDEEYARRRTEFERASAAAVEARRETEIEEVLADEPQEEHRSAPQTVQQKTREHLFPFTGGIGPVQPWVHGGLGSAFIPPQWLVPGQDHTSPTPISADGHVVGSAFPVPLGVPFVDLEIGTGDLGVDAVVAREPADAAAHSPHGADPTSPRERLVETMMRLEARWAALMADAYSSEFTVRTDVVEKRAESGARDGAVIDVLLDPPASTPWGQLAFELKAVSSVQALRRMIGPAMRRASDIGDILAGGSAYSGTTQTAPAAVTAILVIITRGDLSVTGRAEADVRRIVETAAGGLPRRAGVLVISEAMLERSSADTVRDRISTLWTGLAELTIIE